jgi:hypothetical protein
MGKLNLKIKDDVDQKFRATVFRRKGLKKGNLTEAVEEAMLLWIDVAKKTGENQNKT